MTAALVSHIVRQNAFKPDEIAVLTPYLGQLRKLKARLGQSFEVFVGGRDVEDLQRKGLDDGGTEQIELLKAPLSKAVRVATVDNFQVPFGYLGRTETRGRWASRYAVSRQRKGNSKRSAVDFRRNGHPSRANGPAPRSYHDWESRGQDAAGSYTSQYAHPTRPAGLELRGVG